MMTIGMIALLVALVSGICLLVAAIRKRPKKKLYWIFLISTLISIIGISVGAPTQKKTISTSTSSSSSAKVTSYTGKSDKVALQEFKEFANTNPSFDDFNNKFYSYSTHNQLAIYNKFLNNRQFTFNVTAIEQGNTRTYFIANSKFHSQNWLNVTEHERPYVIVVRSNKTFSTGHQSTITVKLTGRGVNLDKSKNQVRAMHSNWDAELIE